MNRNCKLWQVSSQTLVASHIFFFNDTATTEIYTLSLHDALPILPNDNANKKLNKYCKMIRVVPGKATTSEKLYPGVRQSTPNRACTRNLA